MPYDGSGWTLPSAEGEYYLLIKFILTTIATGLYDPGLEKDACGVGFIVHIDGQTTHDVLVSAQELSRRMTHRGACSADNDSGDGAGALIGVPHSFYQHKLREEFSLELPESGKYGTGLIFMDPETTEQTK